MCQRLLIGIFDLASGLLVVKDSAMVGSVVLGSREGRFYVAVLPSRDPSLGYGRRKIQVLEARAFQDSVIFKVKHSL